MSETLLPSFELNIIGAGGLARDFIVCFKDEIKIAGYWDDGLAKGTLVLGFPVLGNLDEFCSLKSSLPYVILVANPIIRKKIADKLKTTKHTSPTIIHSLARIFETTTVKLGHGTVIFPGTMITTDVTTGEHTLIHTNCSLHHDSIVGSHCVLMPGARLTGNVTIGNDVYISPNIGLTNGMKIEDGAKF